MTSQHLFILTTTTTTTTTTNKNCLTLALDFYLGHLEIQEISLDNESELNTYPVLNEEWT